MILVTVACGALCLVSIAVRIIVAMVVGSRVVCLRIPYKHKNPIILINTDINSNPICLNMLMISSSILGLYLETHNALHSFLTSIEMICSGKSL